MKKLLTLTLLILTITKTNPANFHEIYQAATNGNQQTINALLSDLTEAEQTLLKRTLLHKVTKEGNLTAVKTLLSANLDPKVMDFTGKYPIDIALRNEEMARSGEEKKQCQEIALWLFLAEYFNPSSEVDYESSLEEHFAIQNVRLCCSAASRNFISIVRWITSIFGIGRTHGGDSALHLVVESGDIIAAQTLLRAGFPVDITDNLLQQTPLHIAAARDRREIAAILLTCGADRYKEDLAWAATPLKIAKEKKHDEMVKTLLETLTPEERSEYTIFSHRNDQGRQPHCG